jgi:hypothetical protein
MEPRHHRRVGSGRSGAEARRVMYKPEPFSSLNMTWRSELVVGAWDLEFAVKIRLAGDTSKALDKNVVVRV